jgi:hypothetical protein
MLLRLPFAFALGKNEIIANTAIRIALKSLLIGLFREVYAERKGVAGTPPVRRLICSRMIQELFRGRSFVDSV